MSQPLLPKLTIGAAVLLLSSALLMTLWSFVVPIFEAPDEPAHWQYARYLRDNKRLPTYGPAFVEANSPPAYYILIAPFAKYTEVPPRLTWPGNVTGSVTPALPRFYQNSYSDYVRYWPIRNARLVTVLISLVTVFFSYAAGLEATGRESTGLLSGSLAAFLPEFTFRGMNISTDSMVAAASATVIYLLIRMIRRGASGRLALAAGAAIGVAFLSKTSALFFPMPFALVIATERTDWKRKVKLLGALLSSVALAAPWLIRNQMLYGDALAKKAMHTAVGNLISQKSITSPYFLHVFPQALTTSFTGVFGWYDLASPTWLYGIFWLIGALGAAGCLYGLIRKRTSLKLIAPLALAVGLNLLVVIEINLMFDQPQGRYMFPSLAALAVLIAIGLENLPYWPARLSRALSVGLVILNIYVLIRVVLPAYWPPPEMAFSDATKVLVPSISTRIRADDLTVSGANPYFVMTADATTTRYNYFKCTLSGAPEHGAMKGAIYLRFCGEDDAERHKIPFDWMCDGTDHQVIIPLWTEPDWSGRLYEIRLAPVDTAGGCPVVQVHIGAASIDGTVTSRVGP